MKKVLLLTLSVLGLCTFAKAQKLDFNLSDTTQLKNFGRFKSDTPLNKLTNKLLFQPFAEINPNQVIALAPYKNSPAVSISPIDHMPVLALTSTDRMPVKQPDINTRYHMPVKKLGNDVITPSPRP